MAMAHVGSHWNCESSLELTVIEYFADMDTVHVHCRRQIKPVHPRLLAKHLIASSETLQNRAHRMYYMIPPFGTVMPLDDIISFEVFFEWFRRNAITIYAVVANRTTFNFKKVSRAGLFDNLSCD